MKKIIFRKGLIMALIPIFLGASINTIALTKVSTSIIDSCDVPTWFIGDEWIYTADPVSFQSDNGSFYGKIENLKRKVVDITTVTHGGEELLVYEISSTGDISGDLIWGQFSGPLVGQMGGISYIRVSDLAEVETGIVSTGIVEILFIDFDYELINDNSFFPPLELYDFPLKLDEQWNLLSNVITTGSFTIEGLITEDISGNDVVNEIVQCNTKELVSVPAGDFDCFKVSYSTDSYWYSPEVGNLVKSEVGQIGRDDSISMDLTLESFTRVTQPIDIILNIDPSEAFIEQEINISGSVVNSDGDPIQNQNVYIDIPRVEQSWTTTTDENGYYYLIIEAPNIIDDTISEGEFGSDGVIVRCNSGSFEGLKVKTLLIIDNIPPNPPNIQGNVEGKAGVEYEYTFTSSDDDGDDILFLVNWGDGTQIETVIPSVPSSTEAKANHKWDNGGTYNITAKTRDEWGACSKWSDPFSVTIPRTKNINILNQIFTRILSRYFIYLPFSSLEDFVTLLTVLPL